MAGPLYFIPEREHVSRGDLAELGLAYAFDREITSCRVLGAGPDGGQGIVVVDAGRAVVGYFGDRQEWIQIPGNPAAAWVGRSTDKPVLPSDLARGEQLPGHPVAMADQQQWIVPVARMFGETADGRPGFFSALPVRMQISPEGQWMEGEVLDRYRHLWETATQWWDAFIASGSESEDAATDPALPTDDFAWQLDAACEVLAINYRLSRAEVSLLGLFEPASPRKILNALIDMPTFEAWLKKNRTESAPGD